MKKLNKKIRALDILANAIYKAPNLEMKEIWTTKWYQLVTLYAKEINHEHERKRSTTILR